MKKLIISLICFLFVSQLSFGQGTIPQGMQYQAVARNLDGEILSNQKISLKLELHSLTREDNESYIETHLATTNKLGLFSLVIGEGDINQGRFRNIPWSTDDIFMAVYLLDENQNEFIKLNDSKLLAVPYAFHAGTANKLTEGNVSQRNSNVLPHEVWSTFGNNRTDDNVHRLGTTDAQDLVIVTNDLQRMRILQDGGVDINGNTNVEGGLDVRGNVQLNIDGESTTVGGQFSVLNGSNSYLSGNLDVGKNLKVNGVSNFLNSINVRGHSNLNRELNVKGSARFQSHVNIQKNLNVEGVSILQADFKVENGAFSHLTGDLQVDGKSNLGDDLTVQNKANTHLTGDLIVDGKSNIGKISVSDSLTTTGPFTVAGGSATTLTGNLNVDGATTMKGDLSVDGGSEFKGRTIFDIEVDGLQTDQESYPVLIKGSKQGLAIDLVPSTTGNDNCLKTHRGNNYISFWRDGEQKGRIEGMGKADLDPTGLISLVTSLVQTPPDVIDALGLDIGSAIGTPPQLEDLIMFQVGKLPSLSEGTLPSLSGGSFGSIEPPIAPHFPTLNRGEFPKLSWPLADRPGISFAPVEDWVGFIDFPEIGAQLTSSPVYESIEAFANTTASGGFCPSNGNVPTPAATIWGAINSGLQPLFGGQGSGPEAYTNFTSQIFSNYTLDILTQGISTVNELFGFISSVSSILDPGDIVTEASDLIVELTNLIIYGSYADINLGVAYESGSGDYAEWLLRENPEEFISPGDVVGVIGGKISKQFIEADNFMVVSKAPLLLGNMPENAKEEAYSEKVAFMGQVPVKVQGEVNVGDYILPSGCGDGLAIAVSPEKMLARDYHRIVGVAWEESTKGNFVNLINTAIGINQNDMANMVEQMQVTLNNIQASLQKLDPSFVAHEYQVEQNNFAQNTNDITLSPNHISKRKDHFANKTYGSKKEMLADVKKVLLENSSIDLSQFPVVDYVFSNPDQAEFLAATYGNILEEMKVTKEKIKVAMDQD